MEEQTHSFLSKFSKIFIAGHKGMVGSAIMRKLISLGFKENNILTKSKLELDLTNQKHVDNFFAKNKIDYVILAAAKVGGISANINYPAEFIYQNMMIQSNVINSAHKYNIQNLIFLGSSCIYPKYNNKKLSEELLLSSYLEKSNEPYAVAKIAGIKMCESYNTQYGRDYRCIMPTNLYGIGDNYHPENSHVIPGLIRRFHEAKINKQGSVVVWGSGKPRREFLNVDDLADACIHIMNIDKNQFSQITKKNNLINVGYGSDITIRELANLISSTIKYKGLIKFSHDEKDGVPQKLLDSSKINSLGWMPNISLKEGLVKTYVNFCNNYN